MKKEESMRLFDNPVLEAMTHVHPLIPLLLWVPVISYTMWFSLTSDQLALSSFLALGICGFLTWTLFEYLIHRYLFHLESENKFVDRIVFLFHGVHHTQPQDSTRLVMPPVPAILMASTIYLMFALLFGFTYSKPFFAFFMLGYLAYDYIHYAVHHVTPKTKVGKYLRKYHNLHHFVEHDQKYGVSSPLWDVVFRTLGKSVK